MKQILILVTLLISFGSVSGEEEEFESKYFLGAKEGIHRDELAKMELNCLPIEEQLKVFLFSLEKTQFELSNSYIESSDLFNRFADLGARRREIVEQVGFPEWQLRVDDTKEDQESVKAEIEILERRINQMVEYNEKYLLIYTALCK